MQPTRIALLVTALLVAFAVLSGVWLWERLSSTEAPPPHPPANTPAVAVAPKASPSAAPLRPPPGYRLAGVAVGDPDSFAVIEAPNGATALYRLDADVPGLGRLTRIDAERVTVHSEQGELEMWLAPAATATATLARSPSARTPTPKRPLPSSGGDTAPGSTPSIARGRPAS
jgi:hypothetical protein